MKRQSTAAAVAALVLALGGVVAWDAGTQSVKADRALTVCNGPARILCLPKRPQIKAPKRVTPTYPGLRVAAA